MRLIRILLALLIFSSLPAQAKVLPVDFDADRNRRLAMLLNQQLKSHHFAGKSLEDRSLATFDLYLRQLDPRKQFLLQRDTRKLRKLAERIDEDLSHGISPLPDDGAKALNMRIKQVTKIAKELFDAGFDPHRTDYLEIDPKKIEHAANIKELKDRWRRILKMQILDTYLDFLKDQPKPSSDKSAYSNKKQPLQEQLQAKLLDTKLWEKALKKTRERNMRFLQRKLQLTRQEHYDLFFDSFAKAHGPHTSYMAPTSKEDFDIHMSGSLEGIGALLREEDGNIKVVRIIPGSAADRQGQLQAEDTILAVSEKDGESVIISDMKLRDAVSLIRGPKGTKVILTVQRADGAKKTIPIVRDVVHIEETYIKSEVIYDKKGHKIGYIRIPSFYRNFADSGESSTSRNVTQDMRTELSKLKQQDKIKGLIIDLRNNGGGSLSDAVSISGLFLPGGPIVQVKNSKGEIKILKDKDTHISYQGPVIILVNKFSASASEIVAAALQDYDRALVIGGDHTHGKGTVQTILDMNRYLPIRIWKQYDDLGALKVTIHQFYRVNGESTQYKGIEPDIIVPTILDHLKSGEKYQDYSLPWDKIEATKFSPWEGYRFDVEKARQLSVQWMTSSDKFQKIRERTAKAADRTERTEVPVYLAGAVKDRLELVELTKDDNGKHLEFSDTEENNGISNKKAPALIDLLAEDPYVQLAVSLMDEMALSTQPLRTSR